MSLRVRFLLVILSILALFCVDLIATKFYLYWSYLWLDNLMHLFGGFLAGNLALIGKEVVDAKGRYDLTDKDFVFIALLGGFLVGIIWELTEYYFGISQLGPNFVRDTVVDLIMDIMGAGIAYITWVKIPHKKI